MTTMKQDEFVAEARRRFGDDPMAWAFVCPNCGDIASAADFRKALDDNGRTGEPASDSLGLICIGRILGALRGPADEWTGRGCDWSANGLFRGPALVELPGGKIVGAFDFATPKEQP